MLHALRRMREIVPPVRGGDSFCKSLSPVVRTILQGYGEIVIVIEIVIACRPTECMNSPCTHLYVECVVRPRDIAYKLRHVNLSWSNPVPRVDDVSAIQPVQGGLRLRV